MRTPDKIGFVPGGGFAIGKPQFQDSPERKAVKEADETMAATDATEKTTEQTATDVIKELAKNNKIPGISI